MLRSTQRVGLRELFKVARIQAATINEETIGFGIGPRMNALGRLDDANPIVEFLTTDDPILASQIADQQLRQQEAEKGLIEQLSRYGVLRGGGDTAATLSRRAMDASGCAAWTLGTT